MKTLSRIVALLAWLALAGTSFAQVAEAPARAPEEQVSFFTRWLPIFIGAGVVIIAALVNRFAPMKRRRIRRVVILYALYLTCIGVSFVLRYFHVDTWADNIHLGAALLEAFTLVNLIALAVFDLLLPAIRVELVSITSDIIVGVAYIVTAFGALQHAGMNPSSLLTTSAVVGGVLTLSLQTTIGNIFGGVALQMDGSIHVGDWLQLENGRQGVVKEIRWRHTVVETRDWDTIIVPNATLLSTNIMILGKRLGKPLQHRMTVYFNVDFRFAPTQVISAVEEALRQGAIQGVAADPPPLCQVYDFAKDTRDSFGYYIVRYWLTDLMYDDAANSRVRARIYAALRRAKIPLARPTQTVFFTQPEDEQTRRLRHRDRQLGALKALELFRSLTDEELVFLSEHLAYAPFTAGETVAVKGSVAHWLYILTEGKVDILTSVAGGATKVVASIDAPGVFGEMGLMTGEPRSADVVAKTDIACYRLDKEAFEQILSQRPEIAEAMSKMLAHRRVELDAIREGLDAEAKRAREASEQKRILGRIQNFFALER